MSHTRGLCRLFTCLPACQSACPSLTLPQSCTKGYLLRDPRRQITMPRFPPLAFIFEPWVECDQVEVTPASAPGQEPKVSVKGEGQFQKRIHGLWCGFGFLGV